MPKKRGSMGGGVKKVIKKGKKGRKYLTLPEGFELFNPEGGKTYKFDVLPYIVKNVKKHPDFAEIPDDIWWRYPYGRHNNIIGPDNSTEVCPATLPKKACIACEERQAIYDDPDGDDDVAGKLKASPRGFYVIRMKSGDHKGKMMIFDISNYCFLDQVTTDIDMGEPEWKNFADLEGGFTLKVRFKNKQIGKGKKASEFAMADRVDFLERKDIDEDILEEVPCLCDMIEIPTSKQFENMFNGVDDDDEDGGDDPEEKEEPETPKEKKIRLKKEKKAADKKAKEKEEEEEPPPDLDWDDLLEMDETELLEVAEAEDLSIDEDDYDDDEELRILIADAMDIDQPEEEEEEPEETPKEKKIRLKKEKKAKEKAEAEKEAAEKKKKDKKGKKKDKDKSGSTQNALKCPFAHQFGIEFEDHADCDEDDCEKYDKCMEAFEKD